MKVLIEMRNGPLERYKASAAVEVSSESVDDAISLLEQVAAGGQASRLIAPERTRIRVLTSALRNLRNREVGAIILGER